ncbi:hypothetical protein BBP40_000509, partial [Aspergillus hancockii]
MAPQRKSKGPRSRAGCITCKLRHVKCDEAKPTCSLCKQAGYKCEGYDNASQAQLRRRIVSSQQPARRPPISADHCIVLRPETREERRCADFFHTKTAQAFTGIFDSALWSHLIPQISEGEPAIRHAMVAIGAMHAEYQTAAAQPLIHSSSTRQFVLQQYNKAIRSLINGMSTTNSQNWELTLTTCCLFICLEILRGNNTQALDHIDAGLRMLLQREQKGAVAGCGSEIYKELRQLLTRVNLQASFFGRLLQPLGFSTVDTASTGTNLSTLSHARIYLDQLMNKALVLIRLCGLERKRRDAQQQQNLEHQQQQLRLEFDSFLAALNKLLQKMSPFIQQSDLRASLMLKVLHRTSLVWILTVLKRDESGFDDYIPDFEAIAGYAEKVVELTVAIDKKKDNQSRFNLEGELIAPLYFLANKCRHPSIRRRAIDLMSRYGKIEGMWNARHYAAVSRLVVEVEEGACPGIVESEKDVDPRARVYECFHFDE